ncbi:multiheme c-type cytochrome, partial [Acinetobacter baumannii]
YSTLLGAKSDAITARLGLGPAKDAQSCLVCHAENAPADRRGSRYQVTDGVGCEACHGPAAAWIASHTRGYKDNAARQADGLYPTWDLQSRAQL